MKVFWSWQSDTPRAAGKEFVRECLDRVVASLGADTTLELPERPEVDQDTQDVPGTPYVFPTILEKIREAAVFVADVTSVARTDKGTKVPNPNVMLELGYALHLKDNRQIILVMNLEQGGPRHLPFDLQMGRWPVSYRLPDSADQTRRSQVRDDLCEALQPAIRDSLLYATERMGRKAETNRAALDAFRVDFNGHWLAYMQNFAARANVLSWTPDSDVLSGYGLRCSAVPSFPFDIPDITDRPEFCVPMPALAGEFAEHLGQPLQIGNVYYRPAMRRWEAGTAGSGLEVFSFRQVVDYTGSISCDYMHAISQRSQQKFFPIGHILWIAISTALMVDYVRRQAGDPTRPYDIEL